MTQTVIDPFAAPASDPFGQPTSGGGKRPKPADLIGELVMLSPIKIDQQPKFRGKPGEVQDRLTADTVVLTGEHAGSYDEMWWTNSPIVKAGQAALRKGQRMILGRIRQFPTTEDKKAGLYQTWQELEAAMAAWAKNPMASEKPSYAVAMDQYTEDDAAVAREYLKNNTKEMAPA